jgi:DNA recombination protein RmuC
MTENAEEIRKLGVELHERLAIVAGYLGTLGERMKKSVDAYNCLVGSFDARVMVTARRFEEMGARSDQELKDLEPIDVQPRVLPASAPIAVAAGAAPVLQADMPA